jgi:hypothetical protein
MPPHHSPRARALPLALAAAALLLVVSPLAAPLVAQRAAGEIFTIEAFLTKYWLDDPDGGHFDVSGAGGRLMFNLGGSSETTNLWLRRPSIGVFAVVTPAEDDVQTLHAGVQFDARIFRGPLRGRIDPFVSLGLGAFRLRTGDAAPAAFAANRSYVDIAATPAVGSYLHLLSSLSLRGDLRDVVVFGDNATSHNLEASLALSVGF